MMDKEIPQRKKEKSPEWIIDNIAEASRNARAIYLLFIGFLAYCALTVTSTNDRQIILNETAHLPIVNLDVPLNDFFILSPVIAIIVFIYLQLYILRLKGLITDLRNNYPPVDKRRLYPWMLNIAEDPEPGITGRLQKIMVNFSLWWLLPIVLILFPLGFLRKHDPLFSYVVGLIPVIGTAVVIWFWYQYEQIKLKGSIQRNRGKISLSIIVLSFEIFFIFFMIPWSSDGDKTGFLRSWLYVDLSYQKLVEEPKKEYKTLYWINLAGANLEGGNFTESILKRADLKKANLKKANFYNANLEGARLDSAQLQGSRLDSAQLRGANLSYAQLDSANLSYAKLQNTNFWGAKLQNTNLTEAQLLATNLTGVELLGSNLTGAQLQGAVLRGAQLQGARLDSAQLQEADLSYAQLDSADLWRVQLQGAHLRRTQLPEANLVRAQLDSAFLSIANLQGADLSHAQLQNAYLFGAQFQSADLKKAFLDSANLEKANLLGAKNLTIEQLSKVKTLYKAELDSILLEGIKRDYPHLLLLPKERILPKRKRR